MQLDIINTAYYEPVWSRKNGEFDLARRDALIYTVLNSDTGETKLIIQPQPEYTFYRTKSSNYTYPKIAISRDEVVELKTPYYLRKFNFAKAIGKDNEYKKMKSENWMDFRDWYEKTIVNSPFLYEIDLSIENQFKLDFARKHPKGDKLKLKKAFADIEVDIEGTDGEVTIENPIAPVNCITFFDEPHMALHAFLLNDQPDNMKMQMIRSDPDKYVREKLKSKLPDIDYKIIQIQFYENEEKLLMDFFSLTHKYKPDFIGYWYMPFDIGYMFNRMRKLKMNIERVCCHPDVPDEFKRIDYYVDPKRNATGNKKSGAESEQLDWVCIAGYTQHIDMRAVYSLLRRRYKEDDYSLENISTKTIGEGKVPLSNFGLNIRTACRKNYEIFLEYALTDTIRLYQMERKLKDMNFWYLNAGSTNLRETHKMSINNKIATIELVTDEENMVIGNNVKYPIWGSISGALVADPSLCYADSEELNGAPSTVYDNCIDKDATSQYPSLSVALNISKATVFYKGTNIYSVQENGETKYIGNGDEFHQLLQTRVLSIFDLCEKYFDLPDFETVYNIYKQKKNIK